MRTNPDENQNLASRNATNGIIARIKACCLVKNRKQDRGLGCGPVGHRIECAG